MFRTGELNVLARGWGRRLVSLLLLGSLCAAFVPLPVMRPGSVKDRSTPYPCQDRPCGCRSAEQCWRSCCCFSNAEKVAWAKEHGVALPAFVHVAAARERQAASPRPRSCCAGGQCQKPPVCDRAAVAKRTWSERGPSDRGANPETSSTDLKYVIGVYAQKCQGRGAFDLFAAWVLLPTPEVAAWSPVLEAELPLENEVPHDLFEEPALPPPRVDFAWHRLA